MSVAAITTTRSLALSNPGVRGFVGQSLLLARRNGSHVLNSRMARSALIPALADKQIQKIIEKQDLKSLKRLNPLLPERSNSKSRFAISSFIPTFFNKKSQNNLSSKTGTMPRPQDDNDVDGSQQSSSFARIYEALKKPKNQKLLVGCVALKIAAIVLGRHFGPKVIMQSGISVIATGIKTTAAIATPFAAQVVAPILISTINAAMPYCFTALMVWYAVHSIKEALKEGYQRGYDTFVEPACAVKKAVTTKMQSFSNSVTGTASAFGTYLSENKEGIGKRSVAVLSLMLPI